MSFQFKGVERDGYRDIEPFDVGQLPEEVRLIDVREPDEFRGELGHLEGAELVPVDKLPEMSSAWPKDAPLLLICRSGRRSSQAAQMLSSVGFTNLANLSGGMLAVCSK